MQKKILHGQNVSSAFSLTIAFVICFGNCYAGSLAKKLSVSRIEKAEHFDFKPNLGQIADNEGKAQKEIQYYAFSGNTGVRCFSNRLSFIFIQDNADRKKVIQGKNTPVEDISSKTSRIDMIFEGAKPSPKIVTEQKEDYVSNYYLGHCSKGILDVPSYKKLTYSGIYNNIDMVLLCKGKNIEYQFIIHPGGDINDIKIKWDGASQIHKVDGEMLYTNEMGAIHETKPLSYLSTGRAVESSFSITEDIVQFKVSPYDHAQTLIIDPTLSWGTYFGGSDYDNGNEVKTDGAGNVYLFGETNSYSGIATTGAYQTSNSGSQDAFLAKFDAKGNLKWATYYGGSDFEYGLGLAVDKTGNSFITGFTNSASGIATSGAYQSSLNGSNDAFLAKFDTKGNLKWGTYYGGSDFDDGFAITLDNADNVYFTGITTSSSLATTGAYQTSFGGSSDAFICKFSSSGALVWFTYFGGSDNDKGLDLTLDNKGSIYLSGLTASTNGIATSGAYQASFTGRSYFGDGYLAKFDTLGTKLSWGTYTGGAEAYCVGFDAANNVYISGSTTSSSGIATIGAYQTVFGGNKDVFIAKFTSAGNIKWATYYGDTMDDYCTGMAVDPDGTVYLSGQTSSSSKFATPGAFQSSNAGGKDAFLAVFGTNGTRKYGTYYGGSGDDKTNYGQGGTLCKDIYGNVYITGYTDSSSGLATSGAYQSSNGGWNDAFLAKFGGFPSKGLFKNDVEIISIDSPSVHFCPGKHSVSVTLANFGTNTLTKATIQWVLNGTAQAAYKWTGSLASDSSISILLGSYNFALGKSYNILAYSNDPNGTTDSNSLNDSASYFSPGSSLNGKYSIGGVSPDYKNFTDAVNSLSFLGVCGEVIFNVRDGSYTEQISIPAIPGASKLNTVTFQSQSLDSSKVILTYPSSNNYSDPNYTILLTNSQWVTIKELTIQRSDTNLFSTVISLQNTASNNKFLNNFITGMKSVSTSYGAFLIKDDNQNGINNVYMNNTFHNGLIGIYLSAGYSGSMSKARGTIIENNIFDSIYGSSIDMDSQDSIDIIGNSIIGENTNHNGINIFNCHNHILIEKNRIYLKRGGVGINDYNCNDTSNYSSILIANNFITVDGNKTSYGVYLFYSGYSDIVFNSINVINSDMSSAGMYVYSYHYGNNIKNNIFANSGGGYGYYVFKGGAYINTSDFNDYYSSGSYIVNWNGNNYSALSNLQAINSKDANSVSINPSFKSSTDLHIRQKNLDNKGTAFKRIKDDIDGKIRDAITPDIGANEFDFYINDLSVQRIETPTNNFCAGTKDIKVTIANYGTSKISTAQIHWSIDGLLQPSFTWTGSLGHAAIDSNIVVGSFNFTGLHNYILKAWTYLPNNNPDTIPSNDTATTNFMVYPIPNSAWTTDLRHNRTAYFHAKDSVEFSYLWNFGDSNSSLSFAPTHTYLKNGDFKISLIVLNKYKCQAKFDSTITIKNTGIMANSAGYEEIELYPNPFTEHINLSYKLVNNARVGIQITDLSGNEMYYLPQGLQPAGFHSCNLELKDLPAGIYIAVIQTGNKRQYKRIVKFY
jgi:hypothetical protein